MKEDNKKRKQNEEHERTPSSPVCYANTDGLRAGFIDETGTEQDSEHYTLPNSPEQIPLLFAEAWMKRDAKYLASLFDSKAEFVNVVGLWWRTRAEIEKAHAYGLSVIFKNSELTVVHTKVRYLTDDIAVVHTKMKLTGQTPPGSDKDSTNIRHTIFSFVVQRIDEHWSCVSAQNTEVIPNAETFVAGSNGELHPIDYRKGK